MQSDHILPRSLLVLSRLIKTNRLQDIIGLCYTHTLRCALLRCTSQNTRRTAQQRVEFNAPLDRIDKYLDILLANQLISDGEAISDRSLPKVCAARWRTARVKDGVER